MLHPKSMQDVADASLIAAAVTALPGLLDELESLRRSLQDEEKAHLDELAHVDMSGRETDAARIAELEREIAECPRIPGYPRPADVIGKLDDDLRAARERIAELGRLVATAVEHLEVVLASPAHEGAIRFVIEARAELGGLVERAR
jgi:hypothetical protein